MTEEEVRAFLEFYNVASSVKYTETRFVGADEHVSFGECYFEDFSEGLTYFLHRINKNKDETDKLLECKFFPYCSYKKALMKDFDDPMDDIVCVSNDGDIEDTVRKLISKDEDGNYYIGKKEVFDKNCQRIDEFEKLQGFKAYQEGHWMRYDHKAVIYREGWYLFV